LHDKYQLALGSHGWKGRRWGGSWRAGSELRLRGRVRRGGCRLCGIAALGSRGGGDASRLQALEQRRRQRLLSSTGRCRCRRSLCSGDGAA